MKYRLGFENIDCAHCASKVEKALNQADEFQSVSINFMLKQIQIETSTELPLEQVMVKAQQVAQSVESDVMITESKKKKSIRKLSKVQSHTDAINTKDENLHNIHDEDSNNNPIKTSHQKRFKSKFLLDQTDLKKLVRIGLSIVLLLVGILMSQSIWFVLGYLIIGYDIIYKATANLVKGKMLDENTLMTIATIAAFAIGEYPEAMAVMIFYQVGEFFQHKAVSYSRKAIEDVMDIRPDFARVSGELISPDEVKIGQIIEVRVGEKIPLDGKVVEGTSYLVMAALTGESAPVLVENQDEVLSGSINKQSVLKIEVTKIFEESTVSKILDLIQNASSKKSKAENFITKFAAWYTPVVVTLALITGVVPSLITGNWNEWIYKSIIFLVISCPCALVVSIPLGFFGGIGAASKKGVLVKGSNYLEKLNEIDTVILDKTGTITKGEFGVKKIITAKGVKEEEILGYAVHAERLSNHPIAKSIAAYGERFDKEEASRYQEIAGEGIVAEVSNQQILAGNERLMRRNNIEFTMINEVGTVVYIAVDGIYKGCLVVTDLIKQDSASAIKALKEQGIKKVVMLTGDKHKVGERVAKEVGVDEAYTELLPQDKVEEVEKIIDKGRKVIFVGDGINDAPVLARADVGVSMGGVGSDAAVEASDIVLLNDELTGVVDVMRIAKTTKRIVTQNIVLALGTKAIVMVLGVFGIASMAMAIFADVGISFIAVLNSIRILYKK